MFLFGSGGGNGSTKEVQVQHEQQQTKPIHSKHNEQRQHLVYPEYKSWWHRPATYSVLLIVLFVLAAIVNRVFFIPEFEKTTLDWFITYAFYGFIGGTFLSGALYTISLAVKEARKHWQDANIFILPNGLPAMYDEIREGFKTGVILDKPGYFDVMQEQAKRDIVAPAELHVNYAPQETYAPSTTGGGYEGGGKDTHSLRALQEQLILDETPEEVSKKLPETVPFFDIIEEREPGHIILGVSEDGSIIQIPIYNLFHHLVGGQSGSGKSVYLRSMVYQLLQEAEDGMDIKVALADIENNTFPEFKSCRHVDWYASNDIEVAQMTSTLITEIERRKTLYESFGKLTPKDITRYNTLAKRHDREGLPIIVAFYDEFSAFMMSAKQEQKKIANSVLQLSLRARKYGVFLVISGQSFKNDFIDSTLTGQFAFNIVFKVKTNMQSISVIGQTGGEKLQNPGEALVKTKTGDIIHVKAPYMEDDELLEALDSFYDEGRKNEVPDLVKEIIAYAYENLGNKVLIKEMEKHFKDRGISRGDIMKNLRWMDDHEFTARNDKNGRVLDWNNIEQYGIRKDI